MFVFLFHVLAWSALEGEAFFSDTADRMSRRALDGARLQFLRKFAGIGTVAAGSDFWRGKFGWADLAVPVGVFTPVLKR